MKRDLSEEHLRQEVTVTLPLGAVLRLAETEQPALATAGARAMPSIPVGADYEGGKFAGITLDGEQLAALVLLPGDFKGPWAEAKDWAEKEGGVLPSRHDQLVLYRNLKSEFQEAYYWSGDKRESDDGYAWGQYFGYGSQPYVYVSSTFRARRVRRFPIR